MYFFLSTKLVWLFILKEVKPSPDGKMIKLRTFDNLFPPLRHSRHSRNRNSQLVNMHNSTIVFRDSLVIHFSSGLFLAYGSSQLSWQNNAPLTQRQWVRILLTPWNVFFFFFFSGLICNCFCIYDCEGHKFIYFSIQQAIPA